MSFGYFVNFSLRLEKMKDKGFTFWNVRKIKMEKKAFEKEKM